jgi:hypothetical protein
MHVHDSLVLITGCIAARWALRGFTEALRANLHGTGLTVTSIVPGRVLSPYFDHNPGSLERGPTLARLIPKLMPEQTAASLLWATERNPRERFISFMRWLLVRLHNLGITVGHHRLLTHRSFETYPWVKGLRLMFGAMAPEGPPGEWASIHLEHHAHSDTDEDPHSPLVNL